MALSVYLKRFFGEIKLLGKSSANDEVFLLAEDDGTFKSSNYGKAGSTVTAFKVETTGEQDVINHGKDSGGNIDPFRTNDNQQAQVEIVSVVTPNDPVTLGTGNTAIFNPGSASTETYLVELWVYNITALPATIDIAVDIGGGTTSDFYRLNDYPLPSREQVGPLYFHLEGNDDLIGLCSAADTATAWTRCWKVRG